MNVSELQVLSTSEPLFTNLDEICIKCKEAPGQNLGAVRSKQNCCETFQSSYSWRTDNVITAKLKERFSLFVTSDILIE